MSAENLKGMSIEMGQHTIPLRNSIIQHFPCKYLYQHHEFCHQFWLELWNWCSAVWFFATVLYHIINEYDVNLISEFRVHISSPFQLNNHPILFRDCSESFRNFQMKYEYLSKKFQPFLVCYQWLPYLLIITTMPLSRSTPPHNNDICSRSLVFNFAHKYKQSHK